MHIFRLLILALPQSGQRSTDEETRLDGRLHIEMSWAYMMGVSAQGVLAELTGRLTGGFLNFN